MSLTKNLPYFTLTMHVVCQVRNSRVSLQIEEVESEGDEGEEGAEGTEGEADG